MAPRPPGRGAFLAERSVSRRATSRLSTGVGLPARIASLCADLPSRGSAGDHAFPPPQVAGASRGAPLGSTACAGVRGAFEFTGASVVLAGARSAPRPGVRSTRESTCAVAGRDDHTDACGAFACGASECVRARRVAGPPGPQTRTAGAGRSADGPRGAPRASFAGTVRGAAPALGAWCRSARQCGACTAAVSAIASAKGAPGTCTHPRRRPAAGPAGPAGAGGASGASRRGGHSQCF